MINQLFLAVFLLTFFVIETLAQTTPEQAIKTARDSFSDVKNRSLEMERVKREANKNPATDNFTPTFPKIKEDFEQIQKINSEIFQTTAVKTPVNYAAVLKYVSEINHRSLRLKLNLFSVETEQKKETKNKQQTVVEPRDIKTLLDILDKSINSFAHNSIFQNVNLVNSLDSLHAQNDLETVIKISSLIKEKAKKLAKGRF